MATAEKLKNYLKSQHVDHEVVLHCHTGSSMETAQAAHVKGESLAKAVIVKDDDGYLMAVIPSHHHVDLGALHKHLRRPLGLATERELGELFPDCEPGAIPALGAAYGVDTVWDSALTGEPEIFLEAGDHRLLVRMSGEQFRRLMGDAWQGPISHHL